MPVVAIVIILVLLAAAMIYAWRSPEASVCAHCSHIIERSQIDEQRWFHRDNGRQQCWPDYDDSPIAEPHPYIAL
jgi:hypothetical protein